MLRAAHEGRGSRAGGICAALACGRAATNEFFVFEVQRTFPNETLGIFGGNRSNRREGGTADSTSYLLIDFLTRGHGERNCQGTARRCPRSHRAGPHRPEHSLSFDQRRPETFRTAIATAFGVEQIPLEPGRIFRLQLRRRTFCGLRGPGLCHGRRTSPEMYWGRYEYA
jgi:hypothetical protein